MYRLLHIALIRPVYKSVVLTVQECIVDTQAHSKPVIEE